ncbi:hypothetical protein SNE40_011140 [Patella caerulea]|uniref:ubiquitinyl hydrolase 1 n=1 Tax=Patella caerulea TaxID=87958 RepID=A0AAN8K2E5_PATCE
MELIFHEKQEGSLCAQHCLNALLQNQYFSAVDLAQIAERLDVREREFMAEGGVHTREYQQFLQQPSSNFDDSGFFSVQVISDALAVWGLEMIPYNSQTEQANQARINPNNERAFICNFQQHWFAVRKLGDQWFNLNSLLTGPELISDTYLSLFLTQLQQEGYSIFIIKGRIPDCEADQLLKIVPAVQTIRPSLLEDPNAQTSKGSSTGELQTALEESRHASDMDDVTLQKALKMSMQGYHDDEAILQSAIEQSMKCENPAAAEISTPSAEEVRQKRLEFFNKQQSSTPSTSTSSTVDISSPQEEETEEEMLKQALEMSMQQGNT